MKSSSLEIPYRLFIISRNCAVMIKLNYSEMKIKYKYIGNG